MNFDALLQEIVDKVESRLDENLPATSEHSQDLVEAMRYAVLGNGKRLRGMLVCATTYALVGQYEQSLNSASALECMHAYSLVHDDLPVMDDADFRRGKLSCHKVYGAGMATLVGDALQPLAFAMVLEDENLNHVQRLEIAQELAQAVSWYGMVGGQAWDIAITPEQPLTLEGLKKLHGAKTGAMFNGAVLIGGLAAGEALTPERRVGLASFSENLGLAFQVVDDILDHTQSEQVTGKPANQDIAMGKQTFPVILGLDQSIQYANELLTVATEELEKLELADSPLADVAERCINRIR